MSTPVVDAALREATGTRAVVVGADVLSSVAALFGRTLGDRSAVVVADERTFEAAGRAVQRWFEEAGRRTEAPHVLPGRPPPKADQGTVERVAAGLRGHDAVPVAVGSGTVNDVVKRAAFACGRPYLAVATAASVDGYTASGAAITGEGFKRTLACPAPLAVLADLRVLGPAPPGLTASGYADLLGKVTAGADWLLADALEVERVDPRPWALVQGPLREATGRPAALRAGDEDALERLVEGLLVSGLAMQMAGSSRPASGAEHQLGHLWEMEAGRADPAGGEPPLHGHRVGVGSVAIAGLYERLLDRDLARLDIPAVVAGWPRWEQAEREVRAAHPAAGPGEAAVAESRAKHAGPDELAARLTLLRERWGALRERLREQLLPAARLRALLGAAGCPTEPEEIGLSQRTLRESYRRARMIRRRYTVLDLAVETGLLDECVDELLALGSRRS